MYRKKEQGAVLIMSLVFLIILTLSGLSSMTYTNVNTKITANVQDQNIAFQSAESILKEGEGEALQLNNEETAKAEQAAKDAGLVGDLATTFINNQVSTAVLAEVNQKPYMYDSGAAYNTMVTNDVGRHFQDINLDNTRQMPFGCENNPPCDGFYVIAYDGVGTYTITVKAVGRSAGTQIILQSRMGLIP